MKPEMLNAYALVLNCDGYEIDGRKVSFIEGINRFRDSAKQAQHYADVKVIIDGESREFTAEDFMERLGFK